MLLYRQACQERLRVKPGLNRKAVCSAILAVAAGAIVGRFPVSQWLLLAVPLTACLWSLVLARSGILSLGGAGSLAALQFTTLAWLLGWRMSAIESGAAAANLILWAGIPLWLVRRRGAGLVAASAVLFGLATGQFAIHSAAADVTQLVSGAATCGFTLWMGRKRLTMPHGLFYPGYLASL
jgi:hypothetical protein